MLVCATCVVPVVFAAHTPSLWAAVALISLAAAAHQGWSANIFTTVSDTFPQRAVGSVVGMGGFAGALGGMIVAKATGYILQATGSYMLIFGMASTAYLAALLVIHLLVPRLEPVEVD
jgi:ACS family hexuronate transporter-like MFS transporter